MGSRGSRVVIVQRVVLDYRLAFYHALHAELEHADIDLRIVQGNGPASEVGAPYDGVVTPWSTRVPSRSIGVLGRRVEWQPALRIVRGADLVVVEQAASHLLNYLLVAGQALGGTPVAFWGHGKNFSTTDADQRAEAVKRLLSRRAHWWFAYTDEVADVVSGLGFPRERITVVHNSTDTRGLVRTMAEVPESSVRALARDLGVVPGRVGLFVGSLRAEKRLDFLWRAAARVREQLPDFQLLVVGGGPLEAQVRECSRRHAWVHHLGPRAGSELARVLRLSTLLLVPGWVGLVVVDAFAAGVPLVASASGPHPPEIAYLHDGVNGRLVDDRGDADVYADAVVALLRDDDRRARLVAGGVAARERLTAEAMAARFAAGVERALR